MCIVIDVNVLHLIFSANDNDFTPVRKWIFEGKGKVVMGGSTYKSELHKVGKYIRIFRLLNDENKLISVDEKLIDAKQKEISKLVDHKCDDQHLIAILAVSLCRLICTKDDRANSYLLQSDLYPAGYRRPKIYKRKRQAQSLLRDCHIADCCKPLVKLNARQVKKLKEKIFST